MAREPQENRCRDTVFIVDEASMITDMDSSGTSVLEDLIQYVYTGQNCRLILMGDTAQLPPVGFGFLSGHVCGCAQKLRAKGE